MRLGECWGCLRSPLNECFAFAAIKEIAGAAGLPVYRLGHLQQRQGSGYTTKGELLDNIDLMFEEKSPDDQDRITAATIREMFRRAHPSRLPGMEEQLSTALASLGWRLQSGEAYPLSFQIGAYVGSLDEETSAALGKALRRLRDGDPSGALAAICGAVDRLTERVYVENGTLGDHAKTPYAARVKAAFGSLYGPFTKRLSGAALSRADVEDIWHRQLRSVTNAGEVLARLRRLSDVHGGDRGSNDALQLATDAAIYIVRIFAIARSPLTT
jgi:hypothetical protein